ncbi:MAG: hypothetical protein D6691_05400 [Candidatus Hydrogenedentota bacterium]|jgi:4-amino-4-deoxy-L-arabinose transferase-like glycosyltransferase|nr:glycosyltransferase family 39 protein [Candidatus Sumerlaea chitinivorans]RMH27895.1 MAG: hypothetical protein D6691_05400 [Candidatus Hydrogenedentota bacterium]GIX43991.1 MAG: hypothetical protein KatS3mg130_0399 [Candidatus Sumerlaea sp.]
MNLTHQVYKTPTGESRSMIQEPVNAFTHRFRLIAAGIFVVAAILYFTALGKTPLRVNAEIRCHDVIANMLERSDYIVPIYNGQPRFHKPPLFYWTVAATSKLVGGFNLTTLRIPPALFALGVLGLILWWGKILGTQREALLAMALLATTYMFVLHARRGSFEMLLTLLCNLSVLLLYLCVQKPSWLTGLGGTLAFGLAFLAKGTPALLYVPLVLFVWLALSHRLRMIFRWQVGTLAVVGILIAISWHLYVIAFRPESRQTIFSELLLPAGVKVGETSSAQHREAFYFYLVNIWRAAFPLSLLIPLTAFHVWHKRGYPPERPERLLVLMVVVPFLVFSSIPMKQDHYLLPAMPALALLSARAIFDVITQCAQLSRKWVTVPVLVTCIILLIASPVVVLGLVLVGDWLRILAVMVGLLCAALGVAGLLALRRAATLNGLGIALIGTALVFWCYFTVIRPVEDGFGSGRLFSDPTYLAQKEAWDQKFERYPLLRKLLDVDRGLKRSKQIQKPVPDEW